MNPAEVAALVERCRTALRKVDAADHRAPLAEAVTDDVAEAIFAIDRFARNHGITLKEWRR